MAVLSGPTIAHEVIRGIPTTSVIASYNKELRISLAGIFNTERLRVYTNADVAGVELGGSLKKPIGTVFISISFKNRKTWKKFIFSGSRLEIKKKAVLTAMLMLKQAVSVK